ncbi:MAG: serine hydrolase [Oscillospiraceae bacterium]|nr:serine hydrolase [Oscillospiraceae bacterium]
MISVKHRKLLSAGTAVLMLTGSLPVQSAAAVPRSFIADAPDADAAAKQVAAAKNELNRIVTGYWRTCAVLLCDMDGTALYSYHPDLMISGASLIKLPYAFYCCEQLEKGVRSLDDTVTYTSAWYHGGAGIIRKNPYGRSYTVRQLLDYAMRYSDNVAYDMLVYLFGIDGFNEMVREWGYETRITQYSRFPAVTASFMRTAMEQVQQHADDSECRRIVWDGLIGSTSGYTRQALGNSVPIALKYGSIPDCWHEVCYVGGEHPYILVILSGAVNYSADVSFVKNVAAAANKLAAAHQAEVNAALLRGDVNFDRKVSPLDAQLALAAYTEALSGKDSGLTGLQLRAADVNGDGSLTIADAQMILQYYTEHVLAGKEGGWDAPDSPHAD